MSGQLEEDIDRMVRHFVRTTHTPAEEHLIVQELVRDYLFLYDMY